MKIGKLVDIFFLMFVRSGRLIYKFIFLNIIMLYAKIIKPILFKLDPEKIHNTTIFLGWFLGSNFLTRTLTSKIFNYKNKKLNINVLGIKFENPIGLSAGFDKDAK